MCWTFSQNRRFAASGAMTAEEQEQRVLYANVLEYEQDHVSYIVFILYSILYSQNSEVMLSYIKTNISER